MKQLQDIGFNVGAGSTMRLLAPSVQTQKFLKKDERGIRKMKRQGKDAKVVEPLALLLKSGVYLDFAFPIPPRAKALKPKVTKILSQMSPSERILAARRMAMMAKYINAIQSALAGGEQKAA